MKNKRVLSFLLTNTIATCALAQSGWIIKLNRTQSPERFLKAHGLKGRVLDSNTSSRWLKVDQLKSLNLKTQSTRGDVRLLGKDFLQDLAGVEYVEEDQIVSISMGGPKPSPKPPVETPDTQDPAYGQPQVTPNDPLYTRLWGLAGVDVKGSTRAAHAWHDVRLKPVSQVVVGVLDTGVSYGHEDLQSALWSTSINGQKVEGYDAIAGDYYAADDQGHGTHVAGTIAAQRGNAKGVAGIASNAKIFPMKFLNSKGSGNLSDAIEALDFAYEVSEIKIINHSWGGGSSSRALEEAFERGRVRGVLMVVAAGNERANNDRTQTYPANIPLDNVISVAALTQAGGLASFSNYGKTKVHLAAPGDAIFSTIFGKNNSYESLSGTSMAAPHVAGAAALVWGLRPQWTYQEVKDQLLKQIRPMTSMSGKSITGGTLDLYRAVKDL